VIDVSREVGTGPHSVFAVLADGWSYAGWVVGNSHVRDVDRGWPSVGTRIHHSAGVWPLQLPDTTEVTAVEQGRLLVLDAHVRRLGTARIKLVLTPLDGGRRTLVVMSEEAVRGVTARIPRPMQGVLLRPRNAESLSRLADLAVGRERLSHDAGRATAR
jgi:hypothetical protein